MPGLFGDDVETELARQPRHYKAGIDRNVLGRPVQNVRNAGADFYVTPQRATIALLDREVLIGPVWEPACGNGAISRVLLERGYQVRSSDLVDRGYGEPGVDFLAQRTPRVGSIITNPPYTDRLPERFLLHALTLADHKVVLFARLLWLEGGRRGATIFNQHTPLRRVYIFSKRVWPQRADYLGHSEEGGTVAFAWYVWEIGYRGPVELEWI